MKTIASCVQEIIVSRPFLEEALAREIINFSALAKDLNAPISRFWKDNRLISDDVTRTQYQGLNTVF